MARGKGEELTPLHLVSHHTGLSREPLITPSSFKLEVQQMGNSPSPQLELQTAFSPEKSTREMVAGYDRELDSAQSFLASKPLMSVTERAGILKRFQSGKHKNGWKVREATFL